MVAAPAPDHIGILEIKEAHRPQVLRVAVAEAYLLDRALHNLGVPSELLVFPGEGHDLANNPWHGKIKVREELKWLQKYGGVPANPGH